MEPLAPIFPKLAKKVVEGLTFEETKEMRNRGLNAPALMKLIRESFKTEEVVRNWFLVFLSCLKLAKSWGKDKEKSENKDRDTPKD
ncbi:hypothetical protein IFM89_020661 [Coptis chinensis]|uniref:Uncharacterized protein n=1 Tax=Coptis chinensis TaxID=261450 RepID=A0A835LBF2_9MAGN|nr:hypothetical protein IFM89_020661 [Coptis chinensis]